MKTEMTEEVLKSKTLVLKVVFFCLSCTVAIAYPTRYKESLSQPTELTTTPKKIKDNFQFNKQVMPIPQNDSKKTQPYKSQVSKLLNDDVYEPVAYKVKLVNSGYKQAQQNDDDDDDDDDGGEYEGAVDYASCKRKRQDEPTERKSVMIIRGFDMMAMDFPVHNGDKECKKPKEGKRKECGLKRQEEDENYQVNKQGECEQDLDEMRNQQKIFHNHKGFPKDVKELPKYPTDKYRDSWGEWSPCSKSCGIGVQSRSRVRPSGSPGRDTQFQACHLADCPGPGEVAGHVMPSQREYRELARS